ncbi:MAG TPA: cyclase family protein [Dehalococcoidia bacterium]|nr:cyclase family protein [Dehalococcoidia bacterium]
MPERPVPTKAEVDSFLHERRNWGRWGADDQVGAINLITPEKRIRAASLVRSGRSVSMSRDFPKTPAPNNLNPAQHYMRKVERGSGGGAMDYYGIFYHGQATTHIDALCHTWDDQGMWGGRQGSEEIAFDGAKWGAIQHWAQGIVTRGVLLDVPRFRKEPYVTVEKPVHGWELEDILVAQGVKLEPGDAIAVHCGRDAWDADGNPPWGSGPARPGLHASCLPFLRDNDVSVLIWDMLDSSPNEYDIPWAVHGAIFAYGVGLVDNALLGPLSEACAAEGSYEFMFMLSPLVVQGGTGSPANPLALF